VASLRYDLRGHGEGEGRQEDAPLSAHLNDVRVALAELRKRAAVTEVSLLAASFSGGMAAYYAARGSGPLARLALITPLLDCKNRFIGQKPYWHEDQIDDGHARELVEVGYAEHSPTFRSGRALLSEVFWVHPRDTLGEITAPTLIPHGAMDTFISIGSSRTAVPLLRAPHRLIEIEGAQHGIAVRDDPRCLNPRSQQWQAFAIRTIAVGRERTAGSLPCACQRLTQPARSWPGTPGAECPDGAGQLAGGALGVGGRGDAQRRQTFLGGNVGLAAERAGIGP